MCVFWLPLFASSSCAKRNLHRTCIRFTYQLTISIHPPLLLLWHVSFVWSWQKGSLIERLAYLKQNWMVINCWKVTFSLPFIKPSEKQSPFVFETFCFSHSLFLSLNLSKLWAVICFSTHLTNAFVIQFVCSMY